MNQSSVQVFGIFMRQFMLRPTQKWTMRTAWKINWMFLEKPFWVLPLAVLGAMIISLMRFLRKIIIP